MLKTIIPIVAACAIKLKYKKRQVKSQYCDWFLRYRNQESGCKNEEYKIKKYCPNGIRKQWRKELIAPKNSMVVTTILALALISIKMYTLHIVYLFSHHQAHIQQLRARIASVLFINI